MKEPRLQDLIEKILNPEKSAEKRVQEQTPGFGKTMRKEIVSEEQKALEQFAKAISEKRINTL